MDMLRELKRTGEAAGGEFHIFANPSSWIKGAHEIVRVADVATVIQAEENGGRFGAHPGMVRRKIAGSIHLTHYNRRALEYKFTQSTATGLRVTMTTR